MELSSLNLNKNSYISGGNKKLFFTATNLLLYPLLLSYSFYSYSALNSAHHYKYLTEFWIGFMI